MEKYDIKTCNSSNIKYSNQCAISIYDEYGARYDPFLGRVLKEGEDAVTLHEEVFPQEKRNIKLFGKWYKKGDILRIKKNKSFLFWDIPFLTYTDEYKILHIYVSGCCTLLNLQDYTTFTEVGSIKADDDFEIKKPSNY